MGLLRFFGCCCKNKTKTFPLTSIMSEAKSEATQLSAMPGRSDAINFAFKMPSEANNNKTSLFVVFPSSSLNTLKNPTLKDLKQALQGIFMGMSFLKTGNASGYTKCGIEKKNLYKTVEDAFQKQTVLHSNYALIELSIFNEFAEDDVIYPELKEIVSIRNREGQELKHENNTVISGESLFGMNAFMTISPINTPANNRRTIYNSM